MNAEIILVENKITLNGAENANARFLSEQLYKIGLNVLGQTEVEKNEEKILVALSEALPRSEIIFLVGGMGSAPDDITKQAVCNSLCIKLLPHEKSRQTLINYLERSGKQPDESELRQIMLPEGCEVFPNDNGTAPGCAICSGNQIIIMMPGKKEQLEPMFVKSVSRFLSSRIGDFTLNHTLNTYGYGKTRITQMLHGFDFPQGVTASVLYENSVDKVMITVVGKTQGECEETYRRTISRLRKLLGDAVFGTDGCTMEDAVVRLLMKSGKTVSTAESCTAGMLSSRITNVSGASSVFGMGVSAYANEVKCEELGVPQEVIDRFGAVSPETAAAMAKGITEKSDSDIGIGITGLAGPGGGTPDKPVGLVYISLYDGKTVFVRRMVEGNGSSDRDTVRNAAVMTALDMIRSYLCGRLKFIAMPRFGSSQGCKIYDGGEIKTNNKHSKKKKEKKGNFISRTLPWKGDSVGEKIRKILLLIFAAVFICSAVYIAMYFIESWKTKGEIDDCRDIFNSTEEGMNNGYNNKIAALREKNGDTIAWIKIPDSEVNNPVMQVDNNDYYLDHDFEKESNRHGTLFVDKNCRIESGYMGKNTIIYGHHMKDGTMFGHLKYFRTDSSDGLDYYRKHPLIEFTNLYAPETEKWKIFAVFVTNADESAGDDSFNYIIPEFASDENFLTFIDAVRERSMLGSTVDVIGTDRILTLSTCIYDLDNERLVVMARRVRDGESEAVDTEGAFYNKNAIYPREYGRRNVDDASVIFVPASIAGSASLLTSKVSSMPAINKSASFGTKKKKSSSASSKSKGSSKSTSSKSSGSAGGRRSTWSYYEDDTETHLTQKSSSSKSSNSKNSSFKINTVTSKREKKDISSKKVTKSDVG